MKSRRGVELDLESQINDIGAFLKAVRLEHPEETLFLMGESMGALLSAAYIDRAARARLETVPDGIILSVPVVGLARPVPTIQRCLLRFAGTIAPRLRFAPGYFVSTKSQPPQITRDQAYHDALRKKTSPYQRFYLGIFDGVGRSDRC